MLFLTLNSPGHFSPSRGLHKGHPREAVGSVMDQDIHSIADVIFMWSPF